MLSSIVLLFIFFFVISYFSRLAGKGGGNFYVLTLVLMGFSMHKAVPISQLTLFLSSLMTVMVFHKKKTLVWSLAFFIVPLAFLGAFVGGFYTKHIYEHLLRQIFAVLLLISGLLMLNFVRVKPVKFSKKDSILFWNFHFMGNVYPINIPLILVVAFLSGFLASIVGLGGGIIMVPVLAFIFRIPMKAIVSVVPVLVLGVSFFGFLGHILHTSLNYAFISIPVLGAILGAYFGSHTVVKVNDKVLKIVFAVSAISSSIIMWLKA